MIFSQLVGLVVHAAHTNVRHSAICCGVNTLGILIGWKVLRMEAMVVQTSWDSSDEGAEGPAAKALRSLEQQVGSPLQ